MPTLPTLPELPSLPSLSSAAVRVPAGAASLLRRCWLARATATEKLRPAVEACVAAASEVSAVVRKNGTEALSAAQPALRSLEAAAKSLKHSLKTVLASWSSSVKSLKPLLESSSATFSASHAALRRVTGRKGPQSKLWFQ